MKTTKKAVPAEALKEMAPVFETCARRAIESILSDSTRVIKVFKPAVGFYNPCSTTCLMQSGNDDYSITVSLGIETTDLENLLPVSAERRMDIIGEIVNQTAGTFLGNPAFVSRFGSVPGRVPIFLPGSTILQNAACLQGMLEVRGIRLFLGAVVQPAVN
jgi:hypothetical protein